MTAAQAVAKGATLLDQQVPGWAERIDLPMLDIGSCYHCILGQLYGDGSELDTSGYEVGRDWFGLTLRDAEEHGFTTAAGLPEFRRLGEAWAAEVLRRVQA